MINIYDRIKERTYTIGTGNFALSGVVQGFSSFSSVYSNSGELFYAVTDGTNYEIGSGLYLSSNNQIKRFPIKSTNSNNLVSFTEGLKEIYVTYPANNAVFSTSGLFPVPQSSGLAFWNSSNALSYSSKFTVDSGNGRIGINKSNPTASIDVGGSSSSSSIKASGFVVGNSGVFFPSGNNGLSSYVGGTQLTHFEMNQTDVNSASVIQLSGTVNQNILLKKQNAGMVFAGPPSGCSPPCSPAYPIFRPLTVEDIPDLSSIYLKSVEIDDASINNGRLSLSSTQSVFDGSGTQLYFTPYNGGYISLPSLQSGKVIWSTINFSDGISGSGVLVTNSSSLLQSNFTPQSDNIYDIFGYIQNSKLKFYITRWFGHETDVYTEDGGSYVPNSGNSYRTFPISKIKGVYCSPSGIQYGYPLARYLGTVKTSLINGSHRFTDTPKQRLIYNSENKVIRQVASKSSSANLSWLASYSYWTKIPVSPVEVVNGLIDSNVDLSLAVRCFLNGVDESTYVCGIVPEDETGDYAECTDILGNYYYGSLASGLMYSDAISSSYGVAMDKTLVSKIVYSPSGYVKLFPVDKGSDGNPLVLLNRYEGEYGIMGTYEC